MHTACREGAAQKNTPFLLRTTSTLQLGDKLRAMRPFCLRAEVRAWLDLAEL